MFFLIFFSLLFRFRGRLALKNQFAILPPFLFGKNGHETAKVEILNSSSSGSAFLIMYHFRKYPSLNSIDLQKLEDNSSSIAEYGNGFLFQPPAYLVLVDNRRHGNFMVTVSCWNGKYGMDLRDRYRITYLPIMLVVSLVLTVLLYRYIKGRTILRANLIIFESCYTLYIIAEISRITCDAIIKDVNGTFSTYHMVYPAQIILIVYRIYTMSLTMTLGFYPVLVSHDYKFRMITYVSLVMNLYFQTILFMINYFFPFYQIDFTKIYIIFLSSYGTYIIKIIFGVIQSCLLQRDVKSETSKRKMILFSIVIGLIDLLILIGEGGLSFFAMGTGGMTMISCVFFDIIDLLILLIPLLIIYKLQQRSLKKKMIRRRRRSSRKLDPPPQVNPEPLLNTESSVHTISEYQV